jgi:hypothetical protein
VPRATRTRPEIEAEIRTARAALILIEDCTPTLEQDSSQQVREARARVDAALEAWAQAS